MKPEERISSFIYLGKVLWHYLNNAEAEETENPAFGEPLTILRQAVTQAELENRWFTQANIRHALSAISGALSKERLNHWLEPYRERIYAASPMETVAVIAAGNIPAVGFHDFLSVLISGKKFLGKLSSDDHRLIPAFAEILSKFHREWEALIDFTDRPLNGFQKIIATGSNSSSNYFNYYFSKYPHIIRKNRNSAAILTGQESSEILRGLADDLFLYFGLGCRSVSKLYVPKDYDFQALILATQHFSPIVQHHKYKNNLDYQRAIYQLNQIPCVDGHHFLLLENPAFASPVAVVHYQYYDDLTAVITELQDHQDSIQCIVSEVELSIPTVRPGLTQSPQLWEYADGVDTMNFLLS